FISIQADEQRVALATRRLEVSDMADVEQIEAAVSDHHAFAAGAHSRPPGGQLIPGNDFVAKFHLKSVCKLIRDWQWRKGPARNLRADRLNAVESPHPGARCLATLRLLSVVNAHDAAEKVERLHAVQAQFAHFDLESLLGGVMLQRFEDVGVGAGATAEE